MPSLRWNIAISALFTLLGGPMLVLGLGPWWITQFRMRDGASPAGIVTGAALICVGLVPLFDSMIRFVRVGRGTLVPVAPTEHLVVSGLYRYVRNPMYVGVLTALAGEAVVLRAVALWEYAALIWLAMHLFVCAYEEPTLTRRHGPAYRAYREHVPRWIPRLRPWAESGEGRETTDASRV